jgi:hypothetical protein
MADVDPRLSSAPVQLVPVAGATIQTELVVCYEMRSIDVSARESARGAWAPSACSRCST